VKISSSWAHFTRISLCVTLSCVTLALGDTPKPGVHPAPLDPLSEREKEAVQDIAKADPEIQRLLGSPQELRVCSIEFIVPSLPEPGTPIKHQRVGRITLYNLTLNRGVAAIVDLVGKQVQEMQPLDQNHIPVAPDDIKQARGLLRTKPGLGVKLGGDLKEFELDTRVLHTNAEGDPCSRERCLAVYFRRDDRYVSSFYAIVNLAQSTVKIVPAEPKN